MKKSTLLLIVILLIGAGLRLFVLDRGNAISDEVLYGFRAIGMLDFDFALYQPSPLEKFNDVIPSWVQLSFHDHPPLVFLVQHGVMGLFGVSLWAMRLSSALFGIASLWFIYDIGKRLFSNRAGIIAAAISAVTVLLVYVGRTGIQESQVIFFMLVTFWSAVRVHENPKWLLLMGFSFGLGLLSKYTSVVIALPVLIYLFINSRTIFKEKWLYLGGAIAILLFSPVLYYNWKLYQTFGHFDFQLSYIFGQDVPYWQVTPGKEIGSVYDRFIGIGKNLWLYAGPLFTTVASLSFVVLLVDGVRNKKKEGVVLVLSIVSIALVFLAIGPAPRFLTMLIPFLALVIGAAGEQLLHVKKIGKYVGVGIVSFFCVAECVYAINSYIAYEPIGVPVYGYSRIHNDQKDWGYNALDRYLEEGLKNTYPELIVPYKYEFLQEIRQQAVDDAIARGKAPARTLFIYNENMSGLGALWVIQRRALYNALPFISAENYMETLSEEDGNFYRRNGFEEFVFIQNTNDTLLTEGGILTTFGDRLESELQDDAIVPDEIINHAGNVMFRVYVFE